MFGEKLSSPRSYALPLLSAMFLSGCSHFKLFDIANHPEVENEAREARKVAKPSISLRAGDRLQSAFRSLGLMDGKTYIVQSDVITSLPGPSAPIFSIDDLKDYFDAYGFVLNTSPEKSGYVRVSLSKNESKTRSLANRDRCRVKLSGALPVGPVIEDICKSANLNCDYADSGATAYAGVLFPFAYSGTCATALEYIAKKSDLALSFTEHGAEFRMMETTTIDLGIPLRDRRVALDILADGRQTGMGSNPNQQMAAGVNTNSMNGAVAGAASGIPQLTGGKGLTSGYQTNYLLSVRNVLDSLKTPWGTWSYIPETGQIFIRDRAAALEAVKATINRMAQSFQGRYAVTLTMYRVTFKNGESVSGSIAGALNDKISYAFGAGLMSYAGMPATSDANGNMALARKNTFQVLSELGTVETLDKYDLTLQAGIPQTLKIANNTEYVRNVSTTAVAGTTAGVTSSVEQANATDGSFITVQARQAEIGKISVDFGAFINRLDGFDTTQTQTSIVKSQRGFERTFDSVAVVDEGIPYVVAVINQKSRAGNSETLPGLEASLMGGLIGGNVSDAGSKTSIVVMIEARRQ